MFLVFNFKRRVIVLNCNIPCVFLVSTNEKIRNFIVLHEKKKKNKKYSLIFENFETIVNIQRNKFTFWTIHPFSKYHYKNNEPHSYRY